MLVSGRVTSRTRDILSYPYIGQVATSKAEPNEDAGNIGGSSLDERNNIISMVPGGRLKNHPKRLRLKADNKNIGVVHSSSRTDSANG